MYVVLNNLKYFFLLLFTKNQREFIVIKIFAQLLVSHIDNVKVIASIHRFVSNYSGYLIIQQYFSHYFTAHKTVGNRTHDFQAKKSCPTALQFQYTRFNRTKYLSINFPEKKLSCSTVHPCQRASSIYHQFSVSPLWC